MFDVGFWELLFILTLALLVLGPDKLPGVVSTAGRWLGRARVLARGLRTQIERELDKPVSSAGSNGEGDAAPQPRAAETTAENEPVESNSADDVDIRK
ncbi:MAG: Sec-independent protein translocase protein TatB [Gammaproteobacteria bacterium]